MLKIQQNKGIFGKMQKYLETLKKCPLFFGIEEESLVRMLHCMGARIDAFDKRDTVFAEGDPAVDIGISPNVGNKFGSELIQIIQF